MKNSICQIKEYESFGTGFFCKIKLYEEKDIFFPVIITNYHILDYNSIKIGKKIELSIIDKGKFINSIIIDESRIKYTNEDYDITIIEIRKEDNLNDINIESILEIDDNIYKENPNNTYNQKSVYIIHYGGNNLSFSSGIIKSINITNSQIIHLCSTEEGSSGSPIINSDNYKRIGIYRGATKKNFNLGTFIRNPIEEFKRIIINKSNYTFDKINDFDENINEIIILYKKTNERKIKIFGKKFVKNNKKFCKIIYNKEEYFLNENFPVENLKPNEDILEIRLIGIRNITDMSFMFCGCNNLISLNNIHKWNTSKIIIYVCCICFML